MQIPIGNTHEMQEMDEESRTPGQVETIKQIVQREDFDFACMNPQDTSGYVGLFHWLWYDKSGGMHLMKIGKRGTVLRHIYGPLDGEPVDLARTE